MNAAIGIVLLVLSPLAGAIAAFGIPKLGRWIGFANISVLGLAVAALARDVFAGSMQVYRVGGGGVPLGIELRADGLAVLMLVVSTAILGIVTLYAQAYFKGDHNEAATRQARYFWPLYFLLWSALNTLLLSTDLISFYVALELIGFAGVALVAVGGTRAAVEAALRYFYTTFSASLIYLLGVALIYRWCGTVDIATLGARFHEGTAIAVALTLMSGGLVVKAALFPMHFWLPPAHASSPAPVSALHSALAVKGALYVLFRLWFEAFPDLMTVSLAQVLGCLGAAAIFWGSLSAWFQARLKLLIAYSTIAQMGYLFLIFPLATNKAVGSSVWQGGLIFLAAHACAKAAMFLAAGNMLHVAGHDRISDVDKFTHVLPVSAFAFGIAGLSLVGLPPSGGFAGKWLFMSSALAQGQWWWVGVILLGSLLTAAYVLRVLTHAFMRVTEPQALVPNSVAPMMEWTALALALLSIGLGFIVVLIPFSAEGLLP